MALYKPRNPKLETSFYLVHQALDFQGSVILHIEEQIAYHRAKCTEQKTYIQSTGTPNGYQIASNLIKIHLKILRAL